MNHSGKSEKLFLDQIMIAGSATGAILSLEESLSFWGGVDPLSGVIIDSHHPQCGLSIRQKLLVLPGIKGSTAGSGALLECFYSGNGPSALLLCQTDTSAVIAATVYHSLTGIVIPVATISSQIAKSLDSDSHWCIDKEYLTPVK
jgi:predicted aconitase with swiveling domain